jgi:hypothetical protein
MSKLKNITREQKKKHKQLPFYFYVYFERFPPAEEP